MLKFVKPGVKKAAMPPGTLIHLGEKKTETVSIDLIRYNKDSIEEKKIDDFSTCRLEKDFDGVCWLNICGIDDTSTIEAIGRNFEIHSLVQEDILNTFHRPKFEDYDDYLFVVLKMLEYYPERKEVISDQISFILGSNFVITFQEEEGDVFDPLRERLRNGKGRSRKMGADYLFYSLIDAVIDNYFVVLEVMGEDIEELEDALLENPESETLSVIQQMKREMIFLRRSVWPLREIINQLLRAESPLISKTTELYLKDVYDHTIQVIETVETFRDMVSALQDLYLSSVSNKMNEVMKVLTIIATIFIPITFIAGIYGMNFDIMPELKWKFGYFFVWGIIVVITAAMVIYFKRKKWM